MSHSDWSSISTRRDRIATTQVAGGRVIIGAVLLTLIVGSETVSADEAPVSRTPNLGLPPSQATLFAHGLSVPSNFVVNPTSDAVDNPDRDFRPRGRSISEDTRTAPDDVSVERGTVWQRLSEFRTQGRVRLLTLWETGGNSVSLQAGKRGGPSLQWTSRLMNHGAAAGGPAHGLLDEFFANPMASAGRGLHLGPRPTAEPIGKLAKTIDAGGNK